MKSRALVVWLVTLLAPLAPEPAGAADPRGELRVAIPWTPSWPSRGAC